MALTPEVSTDLTGLSVLVVEDEYFVANDSARALRDHGARILGPVPDVQRARELLAGESPDVVLLDVNLKGEMVYPLAEELLRYGVPMIFATGYDASYLPATLRGTPCLQKPIESHELVRAVKVHAARQ
ncbi:MAG TPA: response regulator [Steroidobacteraceae bacterium]